MNLPANSPLSPTTRPENPLSVILADSGRVAGALFHDIRCLDIGDLEARITRAEAFLADAEPHRALLATALEPAPMAEIRKQIEPFVSAWPNASASDLAGYGLQLGADVVERGPSRYALREGLRHLRQTSRFVPSIAEVLAALDAAESRVRGAAYHIDRMPGDIAKARHELERSRQRATASKDRLAALGVVEQP